MNSRLLRSNARSTREAESALAGSTEHVHQLQLGLDDARDKVDRFEWKLEDAERR